MLILRRILILFLGFLLVIKLSWGINYLEKVNENLSGNPEISYVSPNYVFNPDAYDHFLVYGLTLEGIDIPKKPILEWHEIMIYSFITGYLTNEFLDD